VIITGRRFTQIGEALFGPKRWLGVLGQMVGKDHSTLWRYSTGETPVSADMRTKLADICRARGQALIRIADEIDP
jgi:hypothetical protein